MLFHHPELRSRSPFSRSHFGAGRDGMRIGPISALGKMGCSIISALGEMGPGHDFIKF